MKSENNFSISTIEIEAIGRLENPEIPMNIHISILQLDPIKCCNPKILIQREM